MYMHRCALICSNLCTCQISERINTNKLTRKRGQVKIHCACYLHPKGRASIVSLMQKVHVIASLVSYALLADDCAILLKDTCISKSFSTCLIHSSGNSMYIYIYIYAL